MIKINKNKLTGMQVTTIITSEQAVKTTIYMDIVNDDFQLKNKIK